MAFPVKKMPTPLGIGAGQTASVQLPLGLTYHRLYFRLNAQSGGSAVDIKAADFGDYIDEIRLMVNGDAKITITAGDLVKLNAYHGITEFDGMIPLFLAQNWLSTIDGEDQTAYGTASGISSFSIEMDLKNSIVVNKLVVSAMQSAPRPFGPHLRIQRYTHPQSVTGPAEIADIIRGNYVLTGLHINTGGIEDVELHVDNRKVMDMDKVVRNAHNGFAGRVAQSGFTHIDLMAENRIGQTMPMAVSDFRLKLDFTETGNFSIYAISIQGA